MYYNIGRISKSYSENKTCTAKPNPIKPAERKRSIVQSGDAKRISQKLPKLRITEMSGSVRKNVLKIPGFIDESKK